MKLNDWCVVTWRDAFTSYDTDWKGLDDFEIGPLLIISAGKLVKKTREYITLAQTVDTCSGRVSSLMSIPTGMIVKSKIVKP